MNRWKTHEDGTVEVNGQIPQLKGGLPDSVYRWRALAEKYGRKFNVPAHWVLGTIFAESNGNPSALNRSDRPHGAGLMQITHPSLRGRHTDAELFDPDLNLEIGVGFLGRLRASGPDSARDLPSVASRYNAGQKSSGEPHAGPAPWGMRATGNHLDRVVAAANSAQRRMQGSADPKPAGGGKTDMLPFFLLFQLMRYLD